MNTDETQILPYETAVNRNHSESVKICVHLWLSSPGFFEQLVDQPHSCLRFSARSKLRDASLHSPRPIRFCCRARDVEAVFAR